MFRPVETYAYYISSLVWIATMLDYTLLNHSKNKARTSRRTCRDQTEVLLKFNSGTRVFHPWRHSQFGAFQIPLYFRSIFPLGKLLSNQFKMKKIFLLFTYTWNCEYQTSKDIKQKKMVYMPFNGPKILQENSVNFLKCISPCIYYIKQTDFIFHCLLSYRGTEDVTTW